MAFGSEVLWEVWQTKDTSATPAREMEKVKCPPSDPSPWPSHITSRPQIFVELLNSLQTGEEDAGGVLLLFFETDRTMAFCVHAETWERKGDSCGGDFQEGAEGFGWSCKGIVALSSLVWSLLKKFHLAWDLERGKLG